MTGDVAQVSGDRGYDSGLCYQAILARDAMPTIPPRRNAKLSREKDPPPFRAERLRVRTAAEIRECRQGDFVRAAGLVIGRQRPSTASGVIFMTLEDETGSVNVVVWPWVAERQRREVLTTRLVEVAGIIEREREVVHLIAGNLRDHTALLGGLDTRSRDFH